jgi:CheY-like chemotaxis protein
MYDPFFTTKEVGKGTNLGLSTIHGIVKSHGGHIFCASQPGKGTSFTIYLPAIQKDVLEPDMADEPYQGIPKTDQAVLLVDAEEALRELGARILERAGYQVLTAPSGEEALELYRQRRSSLGMVIMDLGMPGIGGNKCLESILKINPEAKVLITSGYVASAQVADALAAGAAGYVAKPFRKADLLKNVRNMLE